MVNLVVPVAGSGRRFKEAGFGLPKQLITVGDKTNIEWSMSCIIPDHDVRTIFIMRRDQQLNHAMDEVFLDKFGSNCEIVIIPEVTEGAMNTVLAAKDLIDNKDPLVVYTPDTYFEPFLQLSSKCFEDRDGHILTFKANNPGYSYVATDEKGHVTSTREKQVISANAAVGVYMFSHGCDFVKAANKMIARNQRTNGEFYICPVYNVLIEQKKKITVEEVDKLHLFGTPEEMDFFITASMRTFWNSRSQVVLCADHSGFDLKEYIKELLSAQSIDFIDYGTFSPRDCDYTSFVQTACQHVLRELNTFGMGFCRTGQGVNITANKVSGIRAALVLDEYMAEHAIRHNCANFFSVPSRYVLEMPKIIDAWKYNTFDGGRHQNRLQGLI
jgi:RpiB/LacA/LacB family sugar-phosphate isomerase